MDNESIGLKTTACQLAGESSIPPLLLAGLRMGAWFEPDDLHVSDTVLRIRRQLSRTLELASMCESRSCAFESG